MKALLKPIFIFCLIIITSCKSADNASSKDTPNEDIAASDLDHDDEQIMKRGPEESSPKNSVVIGKLVERIASTTQDVEWNDKCSNHPCRGKIELLALSNRGSNFHGQYNEGDTIEVRFVFTLDPTDKIYPELNTPLPGLMVGDFFEAELFERESKDYRIQLYDKK